MASGELADYSCPDCGHTRLPRDNTAKSVFRCPECGNRIHEAVAKSAETLRSLADRQDKIGDYARTLLETGGVAK